MPISKRAGSPAALRTLHLRKRPMASTRRVNLFRRQILLRVSPAGFEVLLASARRQSEGQVQPDGRYFGSTMFTLDLSTLGDRLREPGDASTVQQLVGLLEQEPDLSQRLVDLALRDARELAGQPLEAPLAEVRFRSQGSTILLDVDLECASVPETVKTSIQ